MNVRVLPLFALFAAACSSVGAPPRDEAFGSFEDRLFADFRSRGKYDAAGHPAKAFVAEAEVACRGNGARRESAFLSDAGGLVSCTHPTHVPFGAFIGNVRLRVSGVPAAVVGSDAMVDISFRIGDNESQIVSLRSAAIRRGEWMDVKLQLPSYRAGVLFVELTPRAGVVVEVDYLEVFPANLGVAIGPGSRVYTSDERISVEVAPDAAPPLLYLDGSHPIALDPTHAVKTEFRGIYSISAGEACGTSTDGTHRLVVRSEGSAARMTLYDADPECNYEGDPDGVAVLATGFEAFPVEVDHDNVSRVAVASLDPARLRGVRVMRLYLPVEFEFAAARVARAIERCQPRVVVSFGQGDGDVRLEQTAYNLSDAGDFSDNRGAQRYRETISLDAPASYDSDLPLGRMRSAAETTLLHAGEILDYGSLRDSTDPGRFVCNDVFYRTQHVTRGTGIRTGFVHLPIKYTFTASLRVQLGNLVAAILTAAAE